MTTQFSGLVMAYETQSEEAFLTTQQVDEARHAQHFNRFYEQVLGLDDTFERPARARARATLTDDFVSSSTATSSTPAGRSSPTRPTSARRSTSSRPTTWSSRARSP